MATKEDLKKIKPLGSGPKKSSSSNKNLNNIKPLKLQMVNEELEMKSYEYFSNDKKKDNNK